jgi:hypothetical protein
MEDILLSTKDTTLHSTCSIGQMPDEQIGELISAMPPGQTAYIYSGDELTLRLAEESISLLQPTRCMINGPGRLEVTIKYETPEDTNMNSYIISAEEVYKDFRGKFVHGQFRGLGRIQWLNGDKYDGNIENNMANGLGKYSYGGRYQGNTVRGEFLNNRIQEGYGFMRFSADGATYVGEIKDRKKHGQGTITYKDGTKTSGNFENDKYIDPSDIIPLQDTKSSLNKKNLDFLSKEHSQTIFMNESGLYSLIFGSKKEEAKLFKRWVTSVVLPSIRKNGTYVSTKLLEYNKDELKGYYNKDCVYILHIKDNIYKSLHKKPY